MSYDGMAVADGQAAGLAWEALVHGGLDCNERDRIRKALLEYCGQDTLGMVSLLDTSNPSEMTRHRRSPNSMEKARSTRV
jgi:hypothetical protein